MKSIITLTFLVLGLTTSVQAHRMLPLGSTIRFADIEKARQLLSSPDAYTAKWSEFDVRSRLQDNNGTVDDLLKFAGEQALAWTVEEEQRIRVILARVDSIIRVHNYYWPLPKEIYLIKSTLKEEGGAGGYTRENFIVLRQDLIFRDASELMKIVLHEIFHVMTRNDAQYRQRFYDCIGFKVDQPLDFPESMKELRLTNPDAHALDSYITLTATDSSVFDAVMLLYAKQPYQGGMFFQYMQIGFAELETGENGLRIRHIDGEPVIRGIGEIADFFDQVGRNTQYIIDPEEILADNFADVIMGAEGLPDPEISNSIRRILKTH